MDYSRALSQYKGLMDESDKAALIRALQAKRNPPVPELPKLSRLDCFLAGVMVGTAATGVVTLIAIFWRILS